MKFLTARWEHLLFFNYSIPEDVLAPYVPAWTSIDRFSDHVFISLVAFLFNKTRVLGIPVPGHRCFEEVNLRFYVVPQNDPTRRSVTFIKEIVPRSVIPIIANRFFYENYVALPMSHVNEEDQHRYSWKNKTENEISATITRELTLPEKGSIAEFITEHYWGYSKGPNCTIEYQVEHPQWPTCQLDQFQILVDFAETYGDEFGFLNKLEPDSVLYARGSEVSVSFPRYLKQKPESCS